jgi:histidinol dehydrogenase
MISIQRLSSRHADFDAALDRLLAFEGAQDAGIDATVADVVAQVKARGDAALIEYTRRFDHLDVSAATELELPRAALQSALHGLSSADREALEFAAQRIRIFHEKQLQHSWRYTESDGTVLGQQVIPLDKVGLYVPGGKASYPSSVLMNAVAAKVAGVGELIVATPTPNGTRNELVLAAAAIAGVDRVFTIGGAQAVAALAYGTATIPQVDKIVGPGNAYVAAAKRRVFGVVGIDMLAGPSEILVICDGNTDADWIAMDLFAQAEHDELAQAILLCPNAAFLERVARSIERQIGDMPRAEIIRASLGNRGALIQVTDLEEACHIANHIAPEHLELSVADPDALLPKIRHAGAIFLGAYSCEALGDYCAGPNHVLPTSRTARFSSPLGVYDFQKRSSIIHASREGAQTLGNVASRLAIGEGLLAHARSAQYRMLKRS